MKNKVTIIIIVFSLLFFFVLFINKNKDSKEVSYLDEKIFCHEKYIDYVNEHVAEIKDNFSYITQPEIYYSPKIDTCIMAFNTGSVAGDDATQDIYAYFIEDLISGGQIFMEIGYYYNQTSEFLEEYKRLNKEDYVSTKDLYYKKMEELGIKLD